MLPKVIGGLTRNGNLKAQVHTNLKTQFSEKIVEDFGLLETPNKDFALPIAEADGVTIYARLSLVITTTDPFIEKTKPKRKSNTEQVYVPFIK
jgi:hypothetical protein